MATLYEERWWDCWDRHEGSRVGHARSIHGRAEDSDTIAGGSESFYTFKCLLAVVEGRSHAMDAEVGICDELWTAPLTSPYGVMRLDVTIYFYGL